MELVFFTLHKPAPAARVSSTWNENESLEEVTAAIPPWAHPLEF